MTRLRTWTVPDITGTVVVEPARRKADGETIAAFVAIAAIEWFCLSQLVLIALVLGGCRAPETAYFKADRATYTAIAPEYGAYVAADPALSPEQRARRARTLDGWRLRIEAAEEAER